MAAMHAAVAGDEAALLVDQDRDRPAPLADRRRDLVDLFGRVRPRVAGVGDERGDAPALDLVGRPCGRRRGVALFFAGQRNSLFKGKKILRVRGRPVARRRPRRNSKPPTLPRVRSAFRSDLRGNDCRASGRATACCAARPRRPPCGRRCGRPPRPRGRSPERCRRRRRARASGGAAPATPA